MTDTTIGINEAATYKAQAKRLMRDMEALLADRSVPSSLRKEVEDVRQALRRTWRDLGDEASAAAAAGEEPEEPEEEAPDRMFRHRLEMAMGEFGFEPVELSEPYPAEHAARLQPPSRYEQVRRQNDKFGPGIDVIWGITEDGKTEMQAIRFDKKRYTEAEAKAWLKDHDMKAIEFAAASEEAEEADKTIDGEQYPPSDFLVVEDEEMPTTFHLQVRRHGKPDHGLMGAAKAALTSPGGHRGKRYQGPDKAKAIAALKKLYEEEEMMFEADMPSATLADRVGGLKKLIRGKNKLALGMLKGMLGDAEGDDKDTLQAVYDAIDGGDWAKASDLLGDVAEVAPVIVVNVMQEAGKDFDWDALEQRIVAAVQDAYTKGADYAKGEDGEASPSDGATEPAAPQEQPTEAAVAEALGESAEGVEVLSEGAVPNDGQGPLTLKVKLIEPGFGNKRDGHYYPAATLARDAHVFEGSKMYETDHRQEDKSTRTWVSTIRKVVGFTDTGAPLAEVVVHDPSFAQRMRNLKAAGMIEQMACSILANGQVRAGEVEGQKARIVEAITDAQAVDWVTRAGAGGQALAIMSEAQSEPDSNKGGKDMAEEDRLVKPSAVAEAQPTEPPAQTEPVQEAAPQPEKVTAECVASILKEAGLPEPATKRLGEREYATEEALREAIVAEVAYLKEVTGSGKVTGLGEAAKPKPAKPAERLEEKNKLLDVIDERYGLRR